MKVFKDVEHSLLFKPFGLKSKQWLSLAVMLYFDLDQPDPVLTEQQMWQTLSKELPQDLPLDIGMPKARGEVLVHGACHAPRGQTVPGLAVAFKVGALHKRLMVFGDRRWKLGTITRPEPFSKMPLTYTQAFGGEGFERNPQGKGIAQVLDADGRVVHPLPNVEDPNHLVLSATDRPEPAGFYPLDITSPQRRKKEGTFDKRWLEEVKPDLPLDTAEDMFNAAPANQQFEGFFTPGDELSIQNMHPDFPLIRSHLPLVRLRFFVTRKESLDPGPDIPEIFSEVANNIDTVWLFPALKRGVALYRGVIEVLDDEFIDVTNIFIASEEFQQQAKPLEYYLEEKRKRLERSVPVDAAPLELARQKRAMAAKKIKNIEKDLEEGKKRALGQAPILKSTPAEKAVVKNRLFASGFENLEKMENMILAMKAKHEGRVRFDLAKLERIRAKMHKASANIDTALGKAEELAAMKAEKVQALSARLKQEIPADKLAERGVDPDNPLNEPKAEPWHDHGFPLVTRWRLNLYNDRQTMANLSRLGFFRRTLRRAWVGLNSVTFGDSLKAWGLEGGQSLDLPAGLVLPRFKEATLTGVLIRPGEITDPSRDFVVPGSDETPLAFVREGNKVVVGLGDEFEALFMEQEVGDFADVCVIKTPDQDAGEQAAKVIDAAEVFVVALPEKEASQEEREALWSKAYPGAELLHLPRGRNLFEAHQQGVDIREWILQAVPEHIREENSFAPPEEESPHKSKMPRLDAGNLVRQTSKEIKDTHQPMVDRLRGLEQSMRAKAQQHPHFQGFATDAQQLTPVERVQATEKRLVSSLTAKRGQLAALGKLTPEIEGNIAVALENIPKLSAMFGTQLTAGLEKAAQAKALVKEKKAEIQSGKLPEKIVKAFKGTSIDLEKRKRLTREEVIEYLETGTPLAGAVLSGLDLSGLDFSNHDLSGVTCAKTNFQGANLSGCDLSGAIAKEADFSKAVLREAILTKTLCNKALFREADLQRARLTKIICNGADMSRVNLAEASLVMVTMEKVVLQNARFDGCSARLCVFAKSDLSQSSFTGVRFTKCLFQVITLDTADFSQAELYSCMFRSIDGQSVVFKEATLGKCGIIQSQLPGVDCTRVAAHNVFFKESDLRQGRFDGSVLDGSQFDSSDLSEANLTRASAKRCRFVRSDLRGADLKGANLFLSSLRKTHLANASFLGANLFGVDFHKAKVADTNFELANLRNTPLDTRTDLL